MEALTEHGFVACTGCGQVHAEATGLIAQLREDVESLERDLRGKRASIKRLRAEQDSSLRTSPHYPGAMRVLQQWREQCAPRAKELGGKRLEQVIARLKGGYSEDELIECVSGYAKFPFIVDRKRAAQGKQSQWYADAELIFRDAKHVDGGLRMARIDASTPLPASTLAVTPWRRVQEANRQAIVAMLTERFGQPLHDDGYLLSPCPRCNIDNGNPFDSTNHSVSLRIAPIGLGWLAKCSACGLTDVQIIQVLHNRQDAA